MGRSTRKPRSKGIDRISNLPDDVLHKILSYLYIFDAVQLSVLSKRWQYIWTTMPYLQFDLDSYYLSRIHDRAIFEKFKYFINWVLISQGANKIIRFVLSSNDFFDEEVIFRWIHATTRRNVRELVLSFRLLKPFELSYCVAACDSLQVLKIRIPDNILKLPNNVGFRQLKFLHLEQLELSNEHLINRLFSKCRLLETLLLVDCSLGALKQLDIASDSLVCLTIHNNMYRVGTYEKCVVRICCPNLKLLDFKAPLIKDVFLRDLFSVEYARIFFYGSGPDEVNEKICTLVHRMISELTYVSDLKLSVLSVSCHLALQGRLCLVSLYRLKTLKLSLGIDEAFMEAMILLLKHSPNLEVLKLWSDENDGWAENLQLHDPDESITCLESHLKSIQFSGFKEDENEIELVSFFLKNARVLEKLTIVWDSSADKSKETIEEVLKLPRTSSQVVVTFRDPKPWSRSKYHRHWYDRY